MVDASPIVRLPRSFVEELRNRRRPDQTLLVIDEDGVAIETRESRAAMLKVAGCYALARAIRQMPVPTGSVLVFVDLERGTNIRTLRLDSLDLYAVEDGADLPSCLKVN